MTISKDTLRGMFTCLMILLVMPSLYWGATVEAFSFDERFYEYLVSFDDVLSYVGLDDVGSGFVFLAIEYLKMALVFPYVVLGHWFTPEGFEYVVFSIEWIWPGAWPFAMFLILAQTRAPF